MTSKKQRIRYSELGPEAPPGAEPGTGAGLPESAPALKPARTPKGKAKPMPATPSAPTIEPILDAGLPRPRRVSSPVELAHALAAVHTAELATIPATADVVAEATSDVIDPSASPSDGPKNLHARARVEEMLMFRVGEERFAVELLAVEEVIDLPIIHHVPEMPPAMLGVVTVRGFLTPVYSPHIAFGLPLLTKEAVLIFRSGRARVGILIDDVEDAVSLDLSDLRSAPLEEEIDNVVLGVVRHSGVLVAIVDADALIAACQAATLQEIA